MIEQRATSISNMWYILSWFCHGTHPSGDLFSALYYVENFHWSLADTDRLSYTLVTFRAAVEYLRGKEVEKWLPKQNKVSQKCEADWPVIYL